MVAASDMELLYKGLYRSIHEKWKGNGFEDFKGNMDITKSKLIDK